MTRSTDRNPLPGRVAADESVLVERAVRDPEAFAELYRQNHPAITRYLRRRVGDRTLVEELVAETFLVALEQIPRYRDRGLPFRAWLYRIATSRVSRWARKEGRRTVQRLDHEPAMESDDPDERRDLARAALLCLAPRFQSVLALHYLEELPVDEVARILQLRPGTVKSRLHRGRDALRVRLEKMRWNR